MRAKLTLLSAFVVGIVGGALISACQTYDFEPVEPLAIAQTTVGGTVSAKLLKPNLMVLLDTSGSMKTAVNPAVPACQTSSGYPCGDPLSGVECDVSKCPTRWSELQGAMSTFLATSGTSARIGMTTYPQTAGAGSCGAATTVRLPIPEVDDADSAGLQQAATAVSSFILSVPNSGAASSPVGGTPTGASIKFVGSQQYLQGTDRSDFILLLTDGLPNCNSQNVNSGILDPAACKCTLSSCNNSTVERIGCLDDLETVKGITALRAQDTPSEFKDIKTIVVGFGAETSAGSAAATLNAMAEAGGFARNCRGDDNACGANDTCDPNTKLCGRRFYQASNQAELSTALKAIIDLLGKQDPCLLKLDPTQAPSDPSLLVVYVNKEPVAQGSDTWTLTAAGVQFQGATCDRIKASTVANPITLEVRAVQRK